MVPQRNIQSKFFKEPSLYYLFIIWRTFFLHKEPFVKQKGSSDVKGSLWNHLDKKCSSMASWSTFIVKSVAHLRDAWLTPPRFHSFFCYSKYVFVSTQCYTTFHLESMTWSVFNDLAWQNLLQRLQWKPTRHITKPWTIPASNSETFK